MTDLVPCPLCGAARDYRIQESSHFKWWNVNCFACGDTVSECRADLNVIGTPARHPNADTAWNEAGAYAEGLRQKVADLERMGSELSAGHCVHKRGIVAGDHGHALCPLAVDLGFPVPSEPHSRKNNTGLHVENARLRDAAIVLDHQLHHTERDHDQACIQITELRAERDRLKAINGELVEVFGEVEKYLSKWTMGDPTWYHNQLAAKARAVIAKVEG